MVFKAAVEEQNANGWSDIRGFFIQMATERSYCLTPLAIVQEAPYCDALAWGIVIPRNDSWTGHTMLLDCCCITFSDSSVEKITTHFMTVREMTKKTHLPIIRAIAELSANYAASEAEAATRAARVARAARADALMAVIALLIASETIMQSTASGAL